MHPFPDTLQNLLECNQGLVTQHQALERNLPLHWLRYYTQLGLLERVGRGVYRQVSSPGFTNQSLLEVTLQVPQGVICCLSALAFYELGTGIPGAVHLAIPLKGRRPKLEYPPLELYYFSPKLFEYGIETHPVSAGSLRVYSREKTLADVLRLKNRLERSVFLEALKAYLATKTRDISTLLTTARVCRVESEMRLLVEAVLA